MGPGTSNKRGDIVVVAALWAVVTVAALWWVYSVDFHPLGASTNAEISDEAFDILMYLATPVTTFVLVVLGYSMVRFRAAPDDRVDAEPVRSNRFFVAIWIVITAALSVYVIFNPGFTGLDALAADTEEEMTIEVEARQWSWSYTYVDHGIEVDSARELVLPVDTLILFRITSVDVIHSFWIPAFRIKKDAVPGLVTEIYMTATEVGDFDADDGFRTQCAELCGAGHARMRTTVTVMEDEAFDRWVDEEKVAEASG
jgi:cytochrome c oxidase subunit 2